MIGIYIITNEINNKVYIGQVGKGNTTIMGRFDSHYKDLNGNKHNNKHLQAAWNKYTELYGEEAFTFDILEECLEEELNDKEEYWIDYFKANDNKYGYNKTIGGEGTKGYKHTQETIQKLSNMFSGENHPNYGMKHTEETKLKMSKNNCSHNPEIVKKRGEKLKGRKFSDEHKQKLSEARKVKTLSEEHKKKISESGKGRIVSEETKQKMSENNAMHNPEHRKKVSEALKGKPKSEEHKQKLRGKEFSDEHKQKISKAQTNKKLTEEHKKKIGENTKKALSDPEKRKKMSEHQKGEKHIRYIKRTDDMYNDIKNNFTRFEFMEKYQCSATIYYYIKREIKKES